MKSRISGHNPGDRIGSIYETAENLDHALLVHERHRGGVILRGIEKQRATLRKFRQARIEGIGCQGVIQGADLVAFPAAP